MMDEERRALFRFMFGTVLLVVAIPALLLVVVIQQVQIRRQRVLIQQMRLHINQHAFSSWDPVP